MSERILAALAQYGFPALFLVVTIASIGVPLPVSLLLIVTGSLVAQGVMPMWLAIGLASTGSVIGGFAFAAAVGVFFGWYPARKAALYRGMVWALAQVRE